MCVFVIYESTLILRYSDYLLPIYIQLVRVRHLQHRMKAEK